MDTQSGQTGGDHRLGGFTSDTVDRVRETGNVWRVPGGELVLPKVFGFCRGVKRALTLLDEAVTNWNRRGKRMFLLGEIIHNPWVNRYFRERGVRILTRAQRQDLERYVTADDGAVIPAFGVPPAIERWLERIGCEVVDSTCGDVLRLWKWAERAAREGYGVVVYGRPNHDETVVTRARLAEAGGRYLVLRSLEAVETFCGMVAGGRDAPEFSQVFDDETTNADSLSSFLRLAQVSQTTMLYSDTLRVRERIREAFEERSGAHEAAGRVLFQPTVCLATQQRQEAAVELCSSGCDVVIVIGGAG
ncbi:MAG: hypothetical protein ACOC93_06815, partial [Planctomycetota bacterium]